MFRGYNVPQCSAINMLYYLCCFCPDSSFSLSHFLGEPSTIYNKTNPDWAPNQNLLISVGFQRRVKNDTNEPRREVKSDYASALLELSHQSTDDMLVKADASPSVEVNRVKDCQSEITKD